MALSQSFPVMALKAAVPSFPSLCRGKPPRPVLTSSGLYACRIEVTPCLLPGIPSALPGSKDTSIDPRASSLPRAVLSHQG